MDIVQTVEKLGVITPFVLPVIMALVNVWGQFGVKGKWQLLSSLATGLILGGGLGYLTLTSTATAVATAISAPVGNTIASVLYGLTIGLTASGVYEVGKKVVAKGYEIAFSKREVG